MAVRKEKIAKVKKESNVKRKSSSRNQGHLTPERTKTALVFLARGRYGKSSAGRISGVV